MKKMRKIKKFDETHLSNFQARYGENILDNDYPSNSFIENILCRKTVRRFQHKEIDSKLIEKLIATAQSAPTSSMLQSWSIISVSKEKRRIFYTKENAHFLGIAKRVETQARPPTDPGNGISLSECSHFFVWCADMSILKYIYTDKSLDMDYSDLAWSRTGAEDASRELHYELRAIIDTAIAAQTFCIAAESLGLGVQYMGSIRNMDLKDDLNLPDKVMPLFGMCVGYSINEDLNLFGGMKINQYKDIPTFIKPRLPQQLVFHQDKHQGINVQKLHEYNKLMRHFYEYYNLGKDWFSRAIDRTFPLVRADKESNPLNFSSLRHLAKKYGFYFE